MKKIFIIAEAGVNHNGSLATAKRMVNVAADAGADAVKYQTYKAERVMTRWAPKAGYQNRTTNENESQQDMARKYELNGRMHEELIAHCQKKGCMFLSSPHDLESIEMLDRLGMEIFKVPSGEITDLPFLRRVGVLRKKVILSTGMAAMEEIGAAIRVLCEAGTSTQNITVLQCNTEYPTPMQDVNLLAMKTIGNRFGVEVGYSDHTIGFETSVAAAALGASVIEKHFTMDKDLEGPDHKASVDPLELKQMIAAIRNVELAMGSSDKVPTRSELENRTIVRKSIVALRPINEGEFFSESNITVKRPASGISPMQWDEIIGKKAKRAFSPDDLIEL